MHIPMPFLSSQYQSPRWQYISESALNPAFNVGAVRAASDVEVDFIELREIVFTSGAKKDTDGVVLTFVVRDSDNEGLWNFFEQSKEVFAETITNYFRQICGEEYEIAEIHYKRGSIIFTVAIAVNSWGVAHQGLLAIVGFLMGSYVPLKMLISDSQQWLPRFKLFIVDFFS